MHGNTHSNPKATLIAKETRAHNLDPRAYFESIIERNDVFATLFEKINKAHDNNELVHYTNLDGVQVPVNGYVIVQDRHGISYVCPIVTKGEFASMEQQIRPLTIDDQKSQQMLLEKTSFGTIEITREEYIDVCSRGFENASRVMLGLQRARMLIDYSLVATCYWPASV